MIVHRPQEGEDLGERMANAMKTAFAEGSQSVIIVSHTIAAV